MINATAPVSTLSEGETSFLNHVARWGSDGYPVERVGSKHWAFQPMFGVGGCPVLFKTKREATARCELYLSLLRDKKAGRI